MQDLEKAEEYEESVLRTDGASMIQRLFLCVILFVGLLAGPLAQAQVGAEELLTISSEGLSKATSASEASREIQAKIISNVAREQALEMIGEKRFQKSKSLVESRIVREAAKFIPFVQPNDPEKLPDGSWKMKVDLRVSLANLRRLVIDAGLMTDADTPVTIFPMVNVVDRAKSVNFRWWMGDINDESRKVVSEWLKIVHRHFHEELMRQGFDLLLPLEAAIGFSPTPLPSAFRVERPSTQDMKAIAEYTGAAMFLRGEVRVKDSQIQIHCEVVPVLGGRTVAEVTRTIEAEAGPPELVIGRKLKKEIPEIARDLATQVFEAWTRGTLVANTIRLAVKGNLTPKQMGDFRNQIMRSMREIKALRERMFEPGRVIFEVDYASTAEDFKTRLKALELSGFSDRYVVDSELGEGDGAKVPFTIELKPKL